MKAPFESYKEIFGQIGKGIHQYRFMGTAIVDYIMTIIGSIFLSYVLKIPLELMTFVVFGLGVIGLLTVQILQACGCDVLAIDLNEDRLQVAREFGAKTIIYLRLFIEQ